MAIECKDCLRRLDEIDELKQKLKDAQLEIRRYLRRSRVEHENDRRKLVRDALAAGHKSAESCLREYDRLFPATPYHAVLRKNRRYHA